MWISAGPNIPTVRWWQHDGITRLIASLSRPNDVQAGGRTEMTELREFVALVESMRAAQKTYFRKRNPETLEESKRLEKRVDAAIKEFSPVGDQASLF
jgi:hypothetical protein